VSDLSPDDLMKADSWATAVVKEESERFDRMARDVADLEEIKEHRKDVLASIKTRIEEEHGGAISEVKLERLARASEEWKSFRGGDFEAVRAAIEAGFNEKKGRLRIRNAERHFEAVQSSLSYRKKELERISG
jgi:hypothetical protein